MYRSFIAFLKNKGIQYDSPDNTLVTFSLDGLNFVFQYREAEDQQFIRLLLPKIEPFEQDRSDVFKRMIDVATSIKLVKSVIINDEVWLSAEQFVVSTENVNLIFERLIDVLKLAYHNYASAAVSKSENQEVQ